MILLSKSDQNVFRLWWLTRCVNIYRKCLILVLFVGPKVLMHQMLYLSKGKMAVSRFCIDLRLNSVTVRDAYTLPRIDDTFDALSGAKLFSTLDLKGAYWQVEVAEEDKCKTVCSVHPLGFWECNRITFGLTNAPATFQRLMESAMHGWFIFEFLFTVSLWYCRL